MHKTVALEWMNEYDGPGHRQDRLYGKCLMVELLRSLCTFHFSVRIHCRTLHGMVDNEWHRDATNRPILRAQRSPDRGESIRMSSLLPEKVEKPIYKSRHLPKKIEKKMVPSN